MQLLLLAPFSATTFDWTLAGGGRTTTVVCKLTFPLQAGTDAPLATSQEPIVVADRAVDGTLVQATDLVPYKAAADVVVTGFAHAPQGKSTTTVSARLVVGEEIDKTLDVSGPRAWLPDGHAGSGEPFDRVPLRWELAAGGPGTANPVGLPAASATAPQIVRGGTRLDRGSVIEPVGLGPVAPTWPLRADRLGGAPAPSASWTTQPLPWTIDSAYFNVAPADQRLKVLHANEAILLFALLRGKEKFGMRLPGMQPRAFVQTALEGKDVPLSADTLWIDTERELAVVTWRGQVPVGVMGQRVVVCLQGRDTVVAWRDLERSVRSEPPPPVVPPPASPPVAAASPPPVPSPAAFAPMPAYIGRAPMPEERPPEPRPAAPAAPAPAVRRPGEVLDLLWFDKAIVPKLRTNRAWRAIVDRMELVPSDDGDDDDAAAGAEDRREIFHVLANAQADEVPALAAGLASAISEDGKLVPPLAITTGELALPFDAAELLRVTISAAKPIVPTDKTFSEVFDAVSAMAEAAALSEPVAHGLTYRLREAFQNVKHTLPPRYLESTAERALLEGRRYQKREVFGAPNLRALLTPPTGDPVPAYLPAMMASRLPLYAKFRVRLVAEVHSQVDSEESHPCALRVLAIARVVPRPTGKS